MGNSNSALDEIYFKNYLTSTKKGKNDIKGLLLFAGSQSILVVIALLIIPLFSQEIQNHYSDKVNTEKNVSTPPIETSPSITQSQESTSQLVQTTSSFDYLYENDVDAETISEVFQYGGHSYQLIRVYNVSGNDIISFCHKKGGYLSHINDEQENEFIASTIGSLGYDIVYFGYSDEQSEGNWYWVDGESSSFVNWRSGEPNNEANEEHYALVSPDGTWNDGKLERDSQSGAIILCEWNTTIETDTSASHLSDYQSHIANVTSSSYLENQTYGDKTYVYIAEKAFDKDVSTCWSEGVDGYGIGESITVSFDDIYEVSEVSIWNGLCTSKDLYDKNSRLHNITIVLSDGIQYDFECSDGWEKRNQTFSFDGNVKTSSLTIIIQSVYEGEKYKDTCISEISIS